jgi:hypothetical protein
MLGLLGGGWHRRRIAVIDHTAADPHWMQPAVPVRTDLCHGPRGKRALEFD